MLEVLRFSWNEHLSDRLIDNRRLENNMPIIRIQMAKGRSQDEKTRLMKAVTEAVQESIGAPPPTIHIMIQEIPSEDIMIAGQLLSEKETKSRI